MALQQEEGLRFVAFDLVDLRLDGSAEGHGTAGTTHLLLHGVRRPQPVCQRNVRIVRVVAGLRGQLGGAGSNA